MRRKQTKAVMTRVIGPALAFALLGAPTAGAETQQSPAAPHIHNYGDLNRACLSWTDQCRTCRRDADGNLVCSNIGIACQPVEVRCLHRTDDGQQKRL